MVIAARAERIAAEGKACNAEAENQALALQVEKMKFQIAQLRHEQYGQSSERDALSNSSSFSSPIWRRPRRRARRPPRSRPRWQREKTVVVQASTAQTRAPAFAGASAARTGRLSGADLCSCCGGKNLRKIGEDVTETLEVVPRQWKVIQHVREKFSCRACEKISQPPAPSHPIAAAAPDRRFSPRYCSRSMVCTFRSIGRVRFKREGIDLDVSTLADWVGAASATLMPLVEMHKSSCLCGRSHPCRRHTGQGSGEKQDADGTAMDLCP